MYKKEMTNMKLERLDKCINELRPLLNEVCEALEDEAENKERLIISECLDKLIVEYMNVTRDPDF